MNCREVQQLLDAFAADELEAAERKTIERHLSECALCQKEAQALRRTISLLGQFQEMDPPVVFIQELRQRIERRQRRGIFDRLLPRPVFARALAVLSCVVIAGFGVWLAVRQFLPSTKVEERYAGDKLDGDRIALLDKTEKRLTELPQTAVPIEAVAEPEAEPINGGIEGRGPRFSNGSAGAEGMPALVPGRPGASVTEEIEGKASPNAAIATMGRPAEPLPPSEMTAAAGEPRAAGLVTRLEDRERVAKEPHAEEAGRTMGKAVVSGPATDLRLSDAYKSEKREQLAKVDAGQMARGGAAGVNEKLKETKEGAPVSPDKEEAGAFYARARQKGGEVTPNETPALAGTRRETQSRPEQGARLGTALEAPVAEHTRDDAGLVGEESSVQSDEMNAPKGGWGNMTGQAALEQETSAPEQWSFYGTGNFVAGYDRSDSLTPELVVYVHDVQQARSQIQKAIADIGGSAEDAGVKKSVRERDEGEGRTDSLLVRLKAGTYEAFRQKLLPRRVGTISGPQAARGEDAVAVQGKTQKKEEEMTLLIRLVKITQQQSQEVLPAQLQPQSQ